jgi:hypothetical protein
MTLTLFFRNEKKLVFCGIRKYGIENGKYLKFTYVGENSSWSFRNSEEVYEGFFMLDAITGYYINR